MYHSDSLSISLAPPEMSEIQRGRTDLAVQAEDPVHPQPEPEGCTQLWPFPTSLQRQSGQVSG